MKILIQNARVIDPQSEFHNKATNILIEDGIISTIKIIHHTTDNKHAIFVNDKPIWQADANAENELCVSTGWVDVFADYCEPGFEHKETITSGLTAAASGGFTDIFLIPNTHPEISTKSIIQFVQQRAQGNIVNLHPMGSATQHAMGKDLAEMMDLRYNGAVAISDGWNPVQNAGLMLKALEYVKAFDGIVIQMPVDKLLSADGQMNEGIISTQLGMPGIPTLAETLMVHRDIELLRYTDSKLHITGISTAASVALIRKAKEDGLHITCSVTPYHLALTDEMLTSYNSAYKVSPPLRSEADRLALIQGLGDGTIDCIASHHRPQEWDSKMKEFEYAADGMAVQEITFNIIWDTVQHYMSIDRLIEAMTTIPRDIFGLTQSKIKIGTSNTLTIFTTNSHLILTAENKKSMAFNNPFVGKELKGKVLGILNNQKIKLNI